MKAMLTASAAAVWMAATTATIGFAAPAAADPADGPCDPQQLTVTAGRTDSGLGHRAVWLNFTLQPGARACQMSGYPTVDAQPNVEGAAPVHAEQTPTGYLGAPVPGGTVTLDPGHGAHAMLEWVGGAELVPGCPTYGHTPIDIPLHVTPPAMSKAFTVPISINLNEGLCNLQVHPLTAD